nr:reverse transcriptase domain-containing protein [Tanacetum cinerariifolium]
VAPLLSPAYLHDPIELDEHLPVYVLEPEYSEYLEPPADDIYAEDQPHADDDVPTALSPGYIADSNLEEDPEEEPKEEENADYANEIEEEDPKEEYLKEKDPKEEESDGNAASEKGPSEGFDDIDASEEDETAVTPPLSRLRRERIYIRPYTPMSPLFEARIPSPPLPIPSPPPIPSSPLPSPVPVETHAPEQDVVAALLMLPSTTRRSEVPKADMPPHKRLCFATPTTRFEVRESLPAAARPPRDLYGFMDTIKAEASNTCRHAKTLHDTERRMMTVVELVNLRVSYEAQTCQRNGEEFHSQLRDAQRDCASIKAEIVALRDQGTLLEDAYTELHEDLLRSEAHNESLEAQNRSLVARIKTIKTRMTEMEDQFQDTRDRAVSHVMCTEALEARSHIDTMEDAEPEYSEYLEPPADDIYAEDQPHADDDVPTALSPGYIADSNLEEDPEEEPKEEENADYANEIEEEDPKEEYLEEKDPKEEESDDASEEDETAVTPPLSRLRRERIYILPVETHAPEQDVVAALLMLPSTTHRSEVPKADMPPHKRLCFATPTTRFERNGEEFHSQLRDAQRDCASIKAEIVALRDQGTLLEDAYTELHEDLLRSEAHNESLEAQNRSLVARIKTIKTRMTEMEDQFQDTRDRAVSHVMCTEALEARSHIDTMEDAEAVQAMIDQAMQRNSTNGDGSHSSGGGPIRLIQSFRAYSYSDFMKCQPLNFRGAEGVFGLSRWFEKMELVFYISGCTVENQVKFATCTMLDAVLTWWNGHVRTLGHDAAYAMTLETFKKKLTNKYYPKGKIKKLKIEQWNLKVRGNDVAAYTQCFQELALMCTKFLADETKKVDKYISGLPDNIYGNVMFARPKTLDEAIEPTNDLMDQKLRTYAERQNENKRKDDDSTRNNQ